MTLIFIVSFIGCKKDHFDGQNKSPDSSANTKIGNLINSFKARMNSKLKFNDNIPTDSAEWYLGATLNSQYGDATAKGLNLWIDSLFITVPIESGHVSIENMSNSFEEIIDSSTQLYYSIESSDRHLLAADVRNYDQSEDEIKFKITSIFLYDPFINDFWDFGEDDYWKYWNMGTNNGGYCAGPNAGDAKESDAAIQIMRSVTFRKPIPTGYFCYIPPFEDVYLHPTNYGNPNSPPSYYMYWYYASDPGFHICLSPTEMDFYLLGAEHIVYTANNATTNPGARPPDLSFIELFLSGDLIPANPSIYMHSGMAYYGTLFETGNLPDNF